VGSGEEDLRCRSLLTEQDAHMINTRTRAGQESTENWRLHFAHKKNKKQTHSI